MTPYRIQEADLEIPSSWVDQSLTVFKIPGTSGTPEASFVISRDATKSMQPFEDYIDSQIRQCEAKLPGFVLKKNEKFLVQNHACAWLDYSWRNGKAETWIRQIFFDRGPQALICTLTSVEAGIKQHDRAWRKLMSSMVLRPLSTPEPDNEPSFPPPGPP